jgi:hypothetical protein
MAEGYADEATSAVKIGDAQVVTTLPLPDTSRAEVEITVPLENLSSSAVTGDAEGLVRRGIVVTKPVTLAPGKSSVKLAASEFSQLSVQHPRLWWPNGYGKPELYTLELSFSEGAGESDRKQLRFGIREITYELSLLDGAGTAAAFGIFADDGQAEGEEQVVDVRHREHSRGSANGPVSDQLPAGVEGGMEVVGASLVPGGEFSPAVRMLDDTRASPYLVIKVNGVRIACRGGSWGMDDSRKRVSRERLEPYFRLHRDANLNIIRNWVGQSTEEVFYDLADEYGLMVWNDFWESTENYNVEAEDPALFLDNARTPFAAFAIIPRLSCGAGETKECRSPFSMRDWRN